MLKEIKLQDPIYRLALQVVFNETDWIQYTEDDASGNQGKYMFFR